MSAALRSRRIANEKAARERARERVHIPENRVLDRNYVIPLGLQCKLVSIIVHIEEGGTADGSEHAYPV